MHARFMSFIAKDDHGCWLWMGYRNKDGYGKFQLAHRRNDLAHRVAWRFFRAEIPVGKYVLHRCDIPACVNPDHLFIGTQRENVLDMFRKGRGNRARGEAAATAKLTVDQVLKIKNDLRRTYLVAKEHNISWAQADRIRRGVSWKHLRRLESGN